MKTLNYLHLYNRNVYEYRDLFHYRGPHSLSIIPPEAVQL